jgi:hypothetical protein
VDERMTGEYSRDVEYEYEYDHVNERNVLAYSSRGRSIPA